MTRTLLIFGLAAVSLAAKDRAWQMGHLLDNSLNPYFKTTAVSNAGGSGGRQDSFVTTDDGKIGVNTHRSEGDVIYDTYVIESEDAAYMVELAHFKSFAAARLMFTKPVSFAVEKDKLWIMDLDKREFETAILKKVERHGTVVAGNAPAPVEPAKVAPAPKVEQAKVEQAKIEQPRPKPQTAKPDNLFATAALPRADANPPKPKPPAPPVKAPPAQTATLRSTSVQNTSVQTAPAQTASVPPAQEGSAAPAQAAPDAVKAEARVQASVSKPPQRPQPEVKAAVPVAKPEPKVEASVTKPPQRPQPVARPEGPVVRASTKDRAWQSGQLLSVPSNNYFFNVTYVSDMEGSAWPFSQGSDGRFTVTGQIAANTASPYTYDSYVIESQFVAYLVQRMRPKTSPPVRLPGTQPLKFAVDKGKMWVLDEQGIEYETKVIKLIQKDAIVDPLARTAAR